MKINIVITKEEEGNRLDYFLGLKFPQFSRSYFSALIKAGLILINGQKIKASYNLKKNDLVEGELPQDKLRESEIKPEDIKLDILFEDENIIVLNKQAGIVVHPAAGNADGTLVNALVFYFPAIKEAVYDKGNPISESRPGLVHRLDKDTSGVMVVAKNARAMHSLSKQIQNRTIEKVYLALCAGWPKSESGRLINFLGRDPKNRKKISEIGESGKEAISDYFVDKYLFDKSGNKISLIRFDIKTGRTHQIRVQSKIMGHPVLGDNFYGNRESEKTSKSNKIERQMLHAHQLTISPLDEKDPVTFTAPLPEDFNHVLSSLHE